MHQASRQVIVEGPSPILKTTMKSRNCSLYFGGSSVLFQQFYLEIFEIFKETYWKTIMRNPILLETHWKPMEKT